ncbi:hypothetical protein TrVE_jg2392 [Triparma verrucosa]|uniref:CENP-V/GFA domain-containing protein n=1 Tax=Triparma verrucosa TaxID=1606542 RepID=A0A9W7BCD5_9STRA|nr:hypothetical protein TrVE_jg2392 [Triparma verrucosa]
MSDSSADTISCQCHCASCVISVPLDHSPHLYHCFCETCTKQSGGTHQSFLTYPSYPSSPIKISGLFSSYKSSPTVTRFFCTNCGCNLGSTVLGKNVFYLNAALNTNVMVVESERAIFVPENERINAVNVNILSAFKNESHIITHHDYGGVDEIDYSQDLNRDGNVKVMFYGVACLDKLTYIDRFDRNTKIGATKIKYMPGGNAGNAACACKDLLDGGKVGIVTKVGGDGSGEIVIEGMRGRGVEVEDVVVAEEGKTLEVNIIIERESKGRTCLSLPREEMVEDIKGEEVKDLPGKTDWAVFDGRHLESALVYARRVKEQGGKVVVEAELRSRSHSIKIEMEHLMGLADYVVMGEDFLTEFYDGKTPKDRCERWKNTIGGPKKWLIVTRGDKGSYLYYTTLLESPAFYIDPDSIVDSTGAGDCFLGSLVAFLAKGVGVSEALQAANWAGMMQLKGEGGRVPIDWNLAKGTLSWL